MIDIRIQDEDFSIGAEYEACRKRVEGDSGAIVTFTGLVRDTLNDDNVASLTLEHYPGMTEASVRSVVDKALKRWQLNDVVVIHRVGTLEPREQIVLVVVASSHRMAAFDAAEYIMDFLKTEAVFWKKEVRNSGVAWVKSTDMDYERRDNW